MKTRALSTFGLRLVSIPLLTPDEDQVSKALVFFKPTIKLMICDLPCVVGCSRVQDTVDEHEKKSEKEDEPQQDTKKQRMSEELLVRATK